METVYNEGTIVIKTLQTIDRMNIPICDFWLSADAVRGSLISLNAKTESDYDFALYSVLKEKKLISTNLLEKFRGTNNFRFENSIPDLVGIQDETFREIFAIECKVRQDTRLYRQIAQIRPYVHYTWAALPVNLLEKYKSFFKDMKIGYMPLPNDNLTNFQELNTISLSYPTMQGDFPKVQQTKGQLAEIQGLERVEWGEEYQGAHALSGTLRMGDLLIVLNHLRKKLYWTWDEIGSVITGSNRLTLKRLQLLSKLDNHLTLSNGTLRMVYMLNDILPDLPNNYEDDEIAELAKISQVRKIMIPEMRKHFLSLPSIQAFIQLLEEVCETKRSNKVNMYDIFVHLIESKKYNLLRWLFIGNSPTSSPGSIKSSDDVCFRCNHSTSCNERIINDSNALITLLDYREGSGNDYITQIRNNDESLHQLIEDPLLIKFLVPYSLVVENKRFLIQLGIIKKQRTLDKNRGKYCPFEDFWEVSKKIDLQIGSFVRSVGG